MVSDAAATKAPIAKVADKVSGVFVPVVIGIALVTVIIWMILGAGLPTALRHAIAVLVISCPCALGLATPTAIMVGTGKGAELGIMIRTAAALETAHAIDCVTFDKTGTLTRGDFRVQKVAGGHDVLKLCASCEQNSTHPIAVSIVAAARERGMELFTPDELEEIPGRGIRASVDGRKVLCGNEELLRGEGVKFESISDESGTCVLVAVDQQFMGYLVIADTIKDGAAEAVQQLNRKGLATVMLTGDSADTANAVARQVGIREVHARLLPQQKLVRLQQVRSESGAAMFVGDGINDAPVLSGADVGAAMGSGADAAIEAADVVFMTSDVRAIPESLEIARQTNRIAWQNVIFALAVKAVVMVLGLLGYASMWLAVFADSGVAMLCVLNSIRLLYRKKK